MSVKTRRTRNQLLIGAAIGSMLFAGVSHAQTGRGRGGATVNPADAAVRAAQQQAAGAAQAQSASQRAVASFRRAAQTRTAMQNAQAAARAAALAAQSHVPNGLGQGGLQVANGVALDAGLWSGATGPVQTTGTDGRTIVTVGQTEAKSILTWDSFNVGRETDLVFNQKGNADWVSLNRVTDVNADPTRILGSIKADGTVLVLNRNGVIFGGASQVNVRNLVASTATITNDQFLNRGIYSTLANGAYAPAFTGAGGTVTVEAGARIDTRAPQSVTAGGGYVLLMGRQVTNAGSITTQKGQALLAAGDDFLVRPGVSTQTNAYSTTRGNEVRALIGAGSTSGTVINSGQIEASRGDITLTGRTLRQDGVLLSTTGVSQRGTIHLLTSAGDALSSVTLGTGSLTTILPDLDSDETAANAQRDALITDSARLDRLRYNDGLAGANGLAQFDNLSRTGDRLDQSRVEIVSGGTVTFGPASDTIAQGGQVSVTAAGRITADADSRIDVSGLRGVTLDMASNSILVNIQGNELRDSPVNRDGTGLKNENVWVDVRDLVYVPTGTGGYAGDRWYTGGGLLEVGGALGNQQHGIGEWASVGGTVTLSGAEVVLRPGSTIDISGGSLDYRSGYVRSTRVMAENGQLYDLANAPAGMKFVSVGNALVRQHDRWGSQYTQVFSNPLFSRGSTMRWEEGYTVGRDAGTLRIFAPTVLMEGDVAAGVVTGQRQAAARPDGVLDGYKTSQNSVALAGGLLIGRTNGFGADGVFGSPVRIGDVDDVAASLPAEGVIPEDRRNTVSLDADRLSGYGLGSLTLASAGSIVIDKALTLADGGHLGLSAASVAIDADVTIRSGTISVGNVAPQSSLSNAAIQFLLGDGAPGFSLGTGATLDLRGVWTNGSDDPSVAPSVAHVDGGNLSVRMVRGSVDLGQGSVVDVSSGATLDDQGKLVGGRGGDVTLIAGADRVEGSIDPQPLTAALTLDGAIRGYGVVGGGQLTLQTPETVAFGANAILQSGMLPAGTRLPGSVRLVEDVTLPAGTTLTFATTQTISVAIPDATTVSSVRADNTVPTTLAADWTVPAGVSGTANGATLERGMVLPAGTKVQFYGLIEAGVVLPSSAFPAGVAIMPATVVLQPGTRLIEPALLTAGQTLPQGAVLDREVRFTPARVLDETLLQSGFSRYDIRSRAGVVVDNGVTLRPQAPVLRITPGSASVASGANPVQALELWQPPEYIADALTGTFAHRAGASLSLTGNDILIGDGARIEVDSGQSIRLETISQLTMNGTLVAHGGSVALLPQKLPQIGALDGSSIWVGKDALIDVSGQAMTAVDALGHRYGFAQDGGEILVGVQDLVPDADGYLAATRAPVIIREGARLIADGASTTIDTPTQTALKAGGTPVTVAGDGGLIRLGSQSGIYNDGLMSARAGGSGAAGGTLNLVLENTPFALAPSRLRVITMAQQGGATGLETDLTPDGAGAIVAETRLGADDIAAAGFGTLDLWSRDAIAFDGDVDLAMSEALIIRRAALTSTGSAIAPNVRLSAPYVLFDGKVETPTIEGLTVPGLQPLSQTTYEVAAENRGSFSLTADLIDVRNTVMFGMSGYVFPTPSVRIEAEIAGFDTVSLTSRGDIRFTGGRLISGGPDMTLTASQLYPTTGAAGTVRVGALRNPLPGDPDWTLTIRGWGDTPAAPLSVFGSLALTAPTIDQGGIVRAPLGTLVVGKELDPNFNGRNYLANVSLRAGSVTSTSAEGLLMPYGGTSDNLAYLYNGEKVAFVDLADFSGDDAFVDLMIDRGVVFGQATVSAEQGSLLDVSGGGKLTGAGFFTGRGGSVDILRTALANANPAAYGFSAPGAEVYALVPTMRGDYAPLSPDAGAGAPAIGRQITLTQAVGDLPAGTYTLMPSTYALLPGAYRIELGGGSVRALDTVTVPDGSFRTTGYLGIANTGVRDALPTLVTITSAKTVRQFSQYNETGYAEFAIANAATFGALRPRLERDASAIQFDFGMATGDVLDFLGTADLSAAAGGRSGTVFVTGRTNIEVRADDGEIASDAASISDEALSRFDAGALVLGGTFSLVQAIAADQIGRAPLGPRVTFNSNVGKVTIRDGASLTSAGQVFLSGDQVTVEGGAVIDTTTGATDGINSSLGYVFSDSSNGYTSEGGAILAIGNGALNFLGAVQDPFQPVNAITIGDGATLRTLGTISLSSSGAPSIGDVDLQARYFALSAPTLDIGTAQSLADAEGVRVGVGLTQAVIDRLLGSSIPVERITLTAGGSMNFFGNVTLDLRGDAGTGKAMLVLNTPALYGLGTADEAAVIAADTIVWNGVGGGVGTPQSPYVSRAPGAVIDGGAGTGLGTLEIDARRIEFGYDPSARAQDQVALDRLALGFAEVTLRASERITANNRGTLSVYQGGTDAQSYAGGVLNLVTPLLTGEAGSSMAYRSGGALTVRAPAGIAATDPSSVSALGAEVKLAGSTVAIDTGIALPSGRLAINARNGITLLDRADIDLSGRAVRFFDVTKYSWGGDALFETTDGGITQAAGSTIDVSARNAAAGLIRLTATGDGGTVALGGALIGSSDAGHDSGAFDIRVRELADFAGLNRQLDLGGFFDARQFVIKTGDLSISDLIRANKIWISVDGGSLTVDGALDASGDKVGSIRLAARDDMVLTDKARLDVRGTVLATDGRGAVIEASNRGSVELGSVAGTVSLASGAVIDLRSADGVSRGQVTINAPRIGADDAGVDAASGLTVRGAASIAVNAFATYAPADGVIDQSLLDQIHADNGAFIDAAGGNAAFAGRIAGLSAYGDAFHLRPGVEIRSAEPDGDLTVTGDLDLSGFRYGAAADPGVLGSGEAGMLVLRAGGDLIVNGSINDGFAPPPVTPDDASWYTPLSILTPGTASTRELTFEAPYNPDYFDYVYLFPSNDTFSDFPVVLSGSITDAYGTYYPGDIIYGALYGTITVAEGTQLSAENPGNASITAEIAREGRNWAVAPMLAAGSQSWSMRLVAGTDLGASDSRTLAAASTLGTRGDIVLNAPGRAGTNGASSAIAVVRTGAAGLELLAGGDYRQESLFGIYSAGTQIEAPAGYDLDRGGIGDGTILGFDNEAYETSLNARRMYFTQGGGDVSIIAQGDMRGFAGYDGESSTSTGDVGNWLWRQGNSDRAELAAWGINFGQYSYDPNLNFGSGGVRLTGFSGIGTLGGGNLTVIAGGDAGSTTNYAALLNASGKIPTDNGLNLAVASTGYVSADGRLVQNGGGALTMKVGGRINTGLSDYQDSPAGSVLNLRGDSVIRAASVGQTRESAYGVSGTKDPRAPEVDLPGERAAYTPMLIAVGDGRLSLQTLDDAAVVTGVDAGRVLVPGGGTAVDDPFSSTRTGFSLWTDRSGYALFSAGGDILQNPVSAYNDDPSFQLYDPGHFSAAAPSGSITTRLVLAPSASGGLELLAGENLFGRASMSSGSADLLATPFSPLWVQADADGRVSATNGYSTQAAYESTLGFGLFAYGQDAATNLHADTPDPVRLYAVAGDVAMQVGSVIQDRNAPDQFTLVAAKPLAMRAGRDILSSGFILNTGPRDVSSIVAGRDVLNSTFKIWGPGLLEVTAGRNIYQALSSPIVRVDQLDSTINSYGAIVAGDTRPGAGIVLTVGVGPAGPNYAAFRDLYLDPANLADPDRPLADPQNEGKVARVYSKELMTWLKDRYGYAGDADGARDYFAALPDSQQGVFLREVYFEELRLSGREYNDADGPRPGSYLRGRQAISTLFPGMSTDTTPGSYSGSVTFLGSAGVHTDFGGDIQIFAPGGGLTLGADGVSPPSTTGLMTQGQGNIEVFSRDSVLLGLSRVFTTFGGGITMWSAQGDINAGRGAKGSIVYAPVRRTYDTYGNVSLSPTVPTSGAGIGTLNPIPEVDPGDIDLIAPLGTIDAGEAGIRVSGNVNLAALQVINAANIQVQGDATGIPLPPVVNTGALTAASSATTAVVNEAAQLAERARPEVRTAMPTILSVRFLGFGD
ncbi:filamentous hemagglutinin family protein [Sphingomonas sp. HF-S3]|uniref:Filamentous hemagglutinin family protein n=1 Tax=Sphingomonas rustica TaxID=3103142 RepID=A0ABV0B2M9_9SPHN